MGNICTNFSEDLRSNGDEPLRVPITQNHSKLGLSIIQSFGATNALFQYLDPIELLLL